MMFYRSDNRSPDQLRPVIINPNFISTADYLAATEAAIVKPGARGIYHVGDEKPVTLQEFLDKACAGDGLRVRKGCGDPVRVRELVQPLLPPARDDDVAGLAPAGAEQAGDEGFADLAAAENRDARARHGRSLRAEPGPSNSLLLGF